MTLIYYIVLVFLTSLSWSWLWAIIAVFVSVLGHYLIKRQFRKSIPLAYLQGLKYMEHRYSLPTSRSTRSEYDFEKDGIDPEDEDEYLVQEE